MDTLKDVLAIGGPKRFGVFTSKVSHTRKLSDGHTTTTSFDGFVDSCDDSTVLAAMSRQSEVSWGAKKDSSRLTQKVSGILGAARNGHEDSLTKIRQIAGGVTAKVEAEEPASV